MGNGIMKTWLDKNSSLYDGLPFMHARGELITYPTVAEIKFDGEFGYIIKREGKVYIANKQEHGRIRTELPILEPFEEIPDESVLLGEMIWGAGKVFRDFQRHKLDPDINLAVHGVIRWDGDDIWKTSHYAQQRLLLDELSIYTNKVVLVPKFIARTAEQLEGFFQKVVSQGFEGLMIKNPMSKYINGDSGLWVKKKNKADNDLVIIGFESGTKRVKTLSVIAGHQVDGKIVRLTNVGNGFKQKEKVNLLARLKRRVIRQEGNEYFVEPEFVIKVRHYGPIYNDDGSVSSVRHPSFLGFRDDCTVADVDTIK